MEFDGVTFATFGAFLTLLLLFVVEHILSDPEGTAECTENVQDDDAVTGIA